MDGWGRLKKKSWEPLLQYHPLKKPLNETTAIHSRHTKLGRGSDPFTGQTGPH